MFTSDVSGRLYSALAHLTTSDLSLWAAPNNKLATGRFLKREDIPRRKSAFARTDPEQIETGKISVANGNTVALSARKLGMT